MGETFSVCVARKSEGEKIVLTPFPALRMVQAAKAEQLSAGFRGMDRIVDPPRRLGQAGGP
jgi:hypothetical protein